MASTGAPGPVALVGSGEYLPVMAEIEGALIEGRPPRFVQIPTAAAPEGDQSLRRWVDLGMAQAERLGVEGVPVLVQDRNDADDAALAALVEGAGLVYLSGGNPAYLADTLAGTRVWSAVLDAWSRGAALAGCSAGAMALGAGFADLRKPIGPGRAGLGVVPWVRVIPHFDRFVGRMPDLVTRHVVHSRPGERLVGIDEDTALVGGLHGWPQGVAPMADTWRVHGRQSVWLLEREGRDEVPTGESVVLP